MELLQLRYFFDAARSQNFTKTAQKYYVPTSSVSQSIKRLEKELGVSLFERGANKVVLSEYGRILYEGVSAAFGALDGAISKIDESRGEVCGEIRLCASTNRRIVTCAIESFSREYPSVRFVLNYGQSPEDDCDIFVTDEMLGDDRYERRELVKEKIMLAVGRESPILKRKNLCIADFSSASFISMPKGSSLYRYTNEICRAAGFEPNISICCDDPYYIRRYVDMGIGAAFVPTKSWKGQFTEKTVLLDLSPVTRNTYVYINRKKLAREAVNRFLECLCGEAENAL